MVSTVPGTDRPLSLFAAWAICALLGYSSSEGFHCAWAFPVPAPAHERLNTNSIAHSGVFEPCLSGALNNPVGKSKCNFSSWFCLKCITNWNHFMSEGSLEMFLKGNAAH